MAKRLGWLLIVIMAMSAALDTGEAFSHGSFGIGLPAEARVGRPVTPVSVAGVGRRTVRRCAAGVYNC